jgi:hypothetical protein
MIIEEDDWISYINHEEPDTIHYGRVVGTVHYHSIQQVVFKNSRKQLCSLPIFEIKKLSNDEVMVLMLESD